MVMNIGSIRTLRVCNSFARQLLAAAVEYPGFLSQMLSFDADKAEEASILDAETWRDQWRILLDSEKSDAEVLRKSGREDVD
jgi:hypothetical protein